MLRTALIAGVTGIVGNNLANQLIANRWQVHGLARRPSADLQGVHFISADLLDPVALTSAIAGLKPTHLFLTTWLRQPTEKENIRINSAMVRNLLDTVAPTGTLQHAALVTGLKHYLGPFESYGKGTLPATPFREDQPRLDIDNFYYAQEDELFAAAHRHKCSWSVHRPHTIIGYALGNAMNMGVTLAVYATICRETGRPFLFPGSSAQWNSLTDMTDARLLARHLEWAATTPAARDQAFNIVNGDVFRWSWMWSRLASWFNIEPAPFPGQGTPLEQQLADAASTWRKIASTHNLVEPNLHHLTSAWHTDADLGRPIEVVTDMTKSRKLGFLDYQPTDESFFDLFTRLRNERIIP
jgi:nucleoside-diphosphate-sugar epimerase